MSLLILDRRHALRRAAEAEVCRIFRRAYGAVIVDFPELLAALVNAEGAPACVAGVRFGLDHSFCEQYLDEPAESLLRRIAGGAVSRDRILEVTTLAGECPGRSLRLLRGIIAAGRDVDMEWGLFTATSRLRSALPRLSLPLIALAPALRERVAQPGNWGSYYDTDPWVCAMPGRTDGTGRRARAKRPSARSPLPDACVTDLAG